MRHATFTLAALLFFALMVVGVYFAFTTRVPGANDFYPRWRGAQLFWLEGVNPYSDQASAAIQRGIYGRLAHPDEDQLLFVYPFYVVFVLLPLVWLPYAWVQAIWLTLLLFSLVGGTLLALRFIDWRPPLWLLTLTLIWALFFYSSARTVILGQFAGVVYLCIMGCLLLLKQRHDGAAGLLLALTTFKPQMVFLVIPALLLWAVGRRRWRFVASFTGWMMGLVALSFLLEPGWLRGFITQVTAYPGYTVIGNPVQIVTTRYLPMWGTAVDWTLRALLLLWMVWAWRGLPQSAISSRRFLSIMSVTFLVTNLVAPETATTNYVMLYLPLLWGLQQVAGWRWGETAVVVFFLLSFVLIWALFLFTLNGDAENSVMFLPLPGLLLGLLLFEKSRLFATTN